MFWFGFVFFRGGGCVRPRVREKESVGTQGQLLRQGEKYLENSLLNLDYHTAFECLQ